MVSPGFNPRVVDYCQAHGLPVYPGRLHAHRDSERAREGTRGAEVLSRRSRWEEHPSSGRSRRPFPGLRFIPTGGIKREHLPGYLKLDQVLACGGSWIAPAAWIDAGAFDRIRDEAARTVAVVRGERPDGGFGG